MDRLPFHQLRHGVDFRIRRVLRGEPRGRAFQDLAHHIELDHLLVVGPRHRQAAARIARQQAFRLQPRDRLAHRRPRRAHPCRQIDFRQPQARRERPVADRGADPLIGFLAQVAGSQGLVHGRPGITLDIMGYVWIQDQ